MKTYMESLKRKAYKCLLIGIACIAAAWGLSCLNLPDAVELLLSVGLAIAGIILILAFDYYLHVYEVEKRGYELMKRRKKLNNN